jgi:hypothetical protein
LGLNQRLDSFSWRKVAGSGAKKKRTGVYSEHFVCASTC